MENCKTPAKAYNYKPDVKPSNGFALLLGMRQDLQHQAGVWRAYAYDYSAKATV